MLNNVVLLLLAVCLSFRSSAQLLPLGSGSTAGVNDWVFAMLNDTDADLLYVGGNFTTAGNLYSPFIASWNGSAWSTIGSGLNGPVRDFCEFQGDIYVAGEFTEAGADTVNYVAMWDGANWNKVGEGFNNFVITLCVFNNQLYAGGVFTMSDADTTVNIARWNGMKWVEVGGGLTGPGTGFVTSVFALTVYQNQLYVGGNFNRANNGTVVLDGNLTRWNGFSWQDIPNYTSDPANLVTCFGQKDGILWVGAHDVAEILTYDGINWLFGNDSPTPSVSVNNPVYAIEFYDGKSFVGGQFDAAGSPTFYDEFVQGIKNQEWFSLDGGVNNSVFSLAEYHDELYIGGAFTRINNGFVQCNNIARWKSPLEINVVKTDVGCFGFADGSVTLNSENGIPPYTYQWENSPVTTNNITGLASGDYLYTVTDNSGRIIEDTVVINSPARLSASGIVTGSSGQNGSISVTVSGGVEPYTYNWNNGESDPAIAGVSSGNYDLIVVDSNGCDTVFAFFVDTIITGFQSVNTGKWNVFPNPVRDVIYIEKAEGLVDDSRAVVYNTLGKRVMELRLPENANKFSMDLGALPRGIYQLGIASNDNREHYNGKLVLR